MPSVKFFFFFFDAFDVMAVGIPGPIAGLLCYHRADKAAGSQGGHWDVSSVAEVNFIWLIRLFYVYIYIYIFVSTFMLA